MSEQSGESGVAVQVVAALKQRCETVATAESLTGGLVGFMITSVAGSSAVYRGGLITYATELKHRLAHVSPTTLDDEGPVAASTAVQMARGAADACGANWGAATTGVAGPDPQDGHRVGQVFVAVAPATGAGAADDDQQVRVRELALTGNRATIRASAARAVLALLLETLAGVDNAIPGDSNSGPAAC